MTYADDFGPFDGRVWLNAAHQGPLPKRAVAAAEAAIAQKRSPHLMADGSFEEVPERLRNALALLIDASPADVILGNSATFGLDLIARGIEWKPGDEVLVADGDFPADVFPWLPLADQGVSVRRLPTGETGLLQANEVQSAINERTKVLCASWVNSFTGWTLDVEALAGVCHSAGVWFVLNVSQGLGARRFSVRGSGVDAITCCGYKWLLGPYGTGFCWMRAAVRESLRRGPCYWLPNVWGSPAGLRSYVPRSDLGGRAFDVFGTANFLNFMPWLASIEYILDVGQDAVQSHDVALVDRLVTGLDTERYELVSPRIGVAQSPLVVVRPQSGGHAADAYERLKAAGVDTALREGCIRFSPHVYNVPGDIDRAMDILETV